MPGARRLLPDVPVSEPDGLDRPSRNWSVPVVSITVALALLVLLAYWVFYPAPGICYGFTWGVNHPYHPIPCGLFPIGH